MSCLFLAGVPVILTGCIDKNYDLSDVDSTSRVPVENLTIPLNLDPVRFGDILKPEGKIQIINIHGVDYYALQESGNFRSENDVKIDMFNIQAPVINPTIKDLQPETSASGRHKSPGIPSFSLKDDNTSGFSYTASDIPSELVHLDYIKPEKPFNYNMTIEVPQFTQLKGLVSSLTINNLRVQLPKGLDVKAPHGSYEPTTGIWSIPSITMSKPSIDLALTSYGINTTPQYADLRINSDRSLDFKGEFAIVDGMIEMNPVDNPDLSLIPSSLHVEINYALESFQVKYISGAVDYKITGLNIAPVTLSDIPDFLKGDQTVIRLANPQLYFQVNNPVSQYNIECTTGISLGAVRENETLTFSPSENIVITNRYGAGPYNFALAVSHDKLVIPSGDINFSQNLQFVPFPTLGNLLAPAQGGAEAGLPSEITIDFENPTIASNNVTDFELGTTYNKFGGTYQLVAPLALCNDSKVIYEKKFDGWYDDALKDLTITALTMTADYTNETPVGLTVRAYPINRQGQPYGNPEAVVASSTLAAGATGELKLELTKEAGIEISGLDGIRIYVELDNPNGETLSPDQCLEMKNLKVTVSGYYQSDFK